MNEKSKILTSESKSNINFNMDIKLKDENIKIKIENDIKRNYGIDLLRIISMINIINLHFNLYSKQLSLKIFSPKFRHIWRLQAFSRYAVNCFGLISGIVGYKRYKFSNLIYLWIQVFFYSITISLYLFFISKNGITKKNLFLSLFPILIKRHWYVNAYFSMYLFLPFINSGIQSIDQKFFKKIIIFFFLFYSIYNVVGSVIFGYKNYHFLNNGYSAMWLLILYIIGSYLGKYIIRNNNKLNIKYLLIYISIYIFSSLFSSEIHYKLTEIKSKINSKLFINYLSPTMVLQAWSLIMVFSRLNIRNYYIKRIISFLTPLTFSVQLIHTRLFKENVKIIKILFSIVNKFNPNLLFFKIYSLSIIIYFICVLIDYIRLLLFKILKIRNLCIMIEKIFPQLINNFI